MNECAVCHVNQSKYSCPACYIRTCSVDCVRRHKKQTECSGSVDSSKFVSRKELSESSVTVNRDYNFLLGLGREIDLSKTNVRATARNIFKRHFSGRNNQVLAKRIKKGDTQGIRENLLEVASREFGNSPTTAFKRDNTLVIQVPPGMSKSLANKTGYDKRSGAFTWTIEWKFIESIEKEEVKFLSYKVKEDTILKDAVPINILENAAPNCSIEKEKLHFYLANVIKVSHPKKSYISLDRELSIKDNLKQKIVLEYPTIYVTLSDETFEGNILSVSSAYMLSDKLKQDDTITERDAQNISTDSCSESSTESDSESNSESSSDSESPPEEAPSNLDSQN